MAQRCASAHYLNDRPRYILGRTIPEAIGLLLAAALGYLAIRATGRLPLTGDLGKWHLLLIFTPPALAIIVSFVVYADGAEPYARQLIGYSLRQLRGVPLWVHTPLATVTRMGRTRLALGRQPDEAVSP